MAIDNGVIIEQSTVGSGSGNYQAFLRVQDSPTEQGFNTNDNNDGLDNVEGNFTHSVQFATLQTVNIGGVDYIEFRLDLNEPNGGTSPNITLEDLKILISNAPAVGGDFDASGVVTAGKFTEAFSLTNPLALVDIRSGSGTDDYRILVPLSKFAGATPGSYITFFSDFSDTSGGFEEFRALPSPANFDLNLDKDVTGTDSAGNGLLDEAGDIINYRIEVINDGNRALTGISVSDPLLGTLTYVSGDVGNDSILGVGEVWVYTGSYAITQADLDSNATIELGNVVAGTIDNTATADSNETGPAQGSAGAPIVYAPSMNIEKNASVPGGSASAGETITYAITVENTGNVSLTGVTVTDPYATTLAADTVSFNGNAYNSGDLDHDNKLNTNETWHYTATHVVTQAEVELEWRGRRQAGEYGHSRHRSDRSGYRYCRSADRLQSGSEHREGRGCGTDGGCCGREAQLHDLGANTGNVTLTGVTVTDPNADAGSIQYVSGDTDGDNQLDVGETWNYTAQHTVTQAELDSNGGGDGDIDNVATADSNETGPDTDDASIPVAVKPA